MSGARRSTATRSGSRYDDSLVAVHDSQRRVGSVGAGDPEPLRVARLSDDAPGTLAWLPLLCGARLVIRKGHRTPYGSRLDDKVVVTPSGCWEWQGRISPKGYAYVRVGARVRRAHIVFYEREHGEGSSAGLDLHHTCEHKACVNPAHLRAVAPGPHRSAARWHRELQP